MTMAAATKSKITPAQPVRAGLGPKLSGCCSRISRSSFLHSTLRVRQARAGRLAIEFDRLNFLLGDNRRFDGLTLRVGQRVWHATSRLRLHVRFQPVLLDGIDDFDQGIERDRFDQI